MSLTEVQVWKSVFGNIVHPRIQDNTASSKRFRCPPWILSKVLKSFAVAMVMALEVNPIVIVVSGDGSVDSNKVIVNGQGQRIDEQQCWGRSTTIINNNINTGNIRNITNYSQKNGTHNYRKNDDTNVHNDISGSKSINSTDTSRNNSRNSEECNHHSNCNSNFNDISTAIHNNYCNININTINKQQCSIKSNDDLNLIHLNSISSANGKIGLQENNNYDNNKDNESNGSHRHSGCCGDKGSRNHLNVPTCRLSRTDGFSSEESLAPGDAPLTASMCSFESSEFSTLSPHHSSNSFDASNYNINFSSPALTRARSQPLQPNSAGCSNGRGAFHARGEVRDDKEKSHTPMHLFPPAKSLKNFVVKRTNSARKSQHSSLSAPAFTPSPSISRNLSLRRTFSNSFRGLAKDNFHISFPTKNKKKPQQRYRIVEAKTGQQDGLSFEVVGKQGFYLRVKASVLMADKDNSDTHFNKDCTYVPLPDMWFPSFFAFESVSKPSYFIRLTTQGDLVLEKYDGTIDFKQEASFQLKRKPCASCLQVGSRTWAKKKSGEFCRGKVVSMDKDKVEVQFDNHKRDTQWITDIKDLVPDIVPRPEDIAVGTKVIAQWLSKYKLTPASLSGSRQKLYPGVVSGVKSGDSYEVMFDDGEMCRDKKALHIRLMRSYYFHDHDHVTDDATIASTLRSTSPNDGNAEKGSLTETCDDSDSSIRRCSINSISLNDKCSEKPTDAFAEHCDALGCSSGCNCSGGSSMEHRHRGQSETKETTDHVVDSVYNNKRILHSGGVPWQTFSQDSGYHGFMKKPSEKTSPKCVSQSKSNSLIRYGTTNSNNSNGATISEIRRSVERGMGQNLVRSKSLEDICGINRCKSRRRNKSSTLD